MKFFVDTADVDAIRELNDLGMVDGVTTNPSIILKSGRDIMEVTREICSITSGSHSFALSTWTMPPTCGFIFSMVTLT